jgi:hypothetical protein|tara:strand:+ start:1411 stop:1860 length:450 start_codon:yes stop_codon:yes gene_type:complete
MIVGFNFNKISAEKNESVKGKIDVNNNVSIKEVQEASFSLGKKDQNGVRFVFEFTSKYEPEVGLIKFEGDVLYVDNEKAIKEIVDSWKKDKKLKKEIMGGILNTVLTKSNVQALILSQQINLPPPIPMPKVNITKKPEKGSAKGKEYIG